jgi:hypothetical protein
MVGRREEDGKKMAGRGDKGSWKQVRRWRKLMRRWTNPRLTGLANEGVWKHLLAGVEGRWKVLKRRAPGASEQHRKVVGRWSEACACMCGRLLEDDWKVLGRCERKSEGRSNGGFKRLAVEDQT